MTVTEAGRNFSAVMDGVESGQEEVVITRNHKPVARLVPEPPEMNALDVLGDLCGTLDDKTADALADAIKSARKGGLREPASRTRRVQRAVAGGRAKRDPRLVTEECRTPAGVPEPAFSG